VYNATGSLVHFLERFENKIIFFYFEKRSSLLQRCKFPSLWTGSKALNPRHGTKQGCQMVYFQTKNPNLGKFWSALDWKVLIYLMAI
jgi:hypothetical protein